MTLTDKQRAELNADLPRDKVRTRKGGGGKQLSYVEGWEVIATLNAIIGAGNWGYECRPELAFREYMEDTTPSGKVWRWHVTYTSACTLTIAGCPQITDHGAGHGIEKDQGAAIESAIKESNTDAIKRCAKSLGNRLGLALYDKEQTHVADATAQPEPVSAETAILVGMLEAEPARAKAIIKARWSKMSAADRAAINAAIARQKAGA